MSVFMAMTACESTSFSRATTHPMANFVGASCSSRSRDLSRDRRGHSMQSSRYIQRETHVTMRETGPWVRIDPSTRHGMTQEGLQRRLTEACTKGDIDIMEQLIRIGADPNYCNPEGTQRPPVYFASRFGKLALLRRLIERHHCDARYTTPRGTTLVHLASLHGHEEIVKYLTGLHGLDASAMNKHHSTPLHHACVGGHPSIVQYLIENLKCDSKVRGDQDETPLHTASTYGRLGIMRYLINMHNCDPSVTTKMGDTPLHLACQHGHIDVVQYLITELKCDPMVKNNYQVTPLHYAAQHNHADIVRKLVLEHKCDSITRTSEGFTALHLGCKYGRVEVVRVLLEEAKVNPSICGPGGKSPIQLAYGHEIVKLLIQHGANAEDAQVNIFPEIPNKPMEDIIRVMVIGDPANGKSTLVEALKTQQTSGIFPPFIRRGQQRVAPIPSFTAGIIPHEFNDADFGHMMLFDFAGHNEYYASHSVVIESAMFTTAPIFVVVIDLSQEQEKIKRRLHYWIQFIENNRPDFVSQPHIIVVGSHLDVVRSSRGNGSESVKNAEVFARETVRSATNLHFAGFYAVNCQRPSTQAELRGCLARCCRSLRTHMRDDSLCHAFSIFLFDNFRGRLMCTIREVAEAIRHSNSAFPFSTSALTDLCNCLSNKVNIMFLKHSTKPEESTIILDVKTLLSEIQAVIFAPKNFKQCRISTRSGVISLTKLRRAFTRLNPKVIAQCMQQLEFCQEICDAEILDLIRGGRRKALDSPDEVEQDGLPGAVRADEEYFFFPCLIGVDHPREIWRPDETKRFCYYTGWCLQCSQEMQCFPPRFLHTLLLRIAFTFAVASLDHPDLVQTHPLGKECNLWKNGIHWFDPWGIESYLELRDDGQVLVLVMRCYKDQEMHCIKLRSAIITKVLETMKSFAHNIQTYEYLLDPQYLTSYPLPSIKQRKIPLYSLMQVLNSITQVYLGLFDISHNTFISLEDLLWWDPYMYLGSDLLKQFLYPSNRDIPITDHFLLQCANTQFAEHWEHIGRYMFQFKPNLLGEIRSCASRDRLDQHCLSLLHEARRQELVRTFGELALYIDQFSILQGRSERILESLPNATMR